MTRGLSRAQVEERLSQHFARHNPGQISQQTPRRIQISAILNSSAVSISGPKADLCAFRAQVSPDLATTFAHVHGWYHGGDQLEDVVQEVLEDSRHREISFTSCSTHTKPIRSTLDGTLFDGSKTSAEEFIGWLTRHLLVYCVNWCNTAHEIAASVKDLLKREPYAAVKIHSFGPSSGSLFPDLQPLDPRIILSDLSPFKAGAKSILSGDQDSVAIVGMSVHLPKGKGTEELWETLSQGLDAVGEIPGTRFNSSDYYSEDIYKPRSMPTKFGAFLEDPFS